MTARWAAASSTSGIRPDCFLELRSNLAIKAKYNGAKYALVLVDKARALIERRAPTAASGTATAKPAKPADAAAVPAAAAKAAAAKPASAAATAIVDDIGDTVPPAKAKAEEEEEEEEEEDKEVVEEEEDIRGRGKEDKVAISHMPSKGNSQVIAQS
ncbi:hypothetical protein P8C59_008203 [Phyllachora maydis]|uniref:Uncharacterized protein n=1 Tax=Phyllachora maydis TaxID=1825666 RepID=A0AAD9MJF6_9PEZI|nr:hypothetical protein P8C59_008203 [Phyllachora maydis]